jgi:hypothetical protein
MFLAAIAVWFVAEARAPKLVEAVELSAYTGGSDQWCVTIQPDGPHCNQCLSNGNGNYVKCRSISFDWKPVYISSQSPALHWQFDEVGCGDMADTYVASDCSGTAFDTDPCGRQYTAATLLHQSYLVNCP